MSIAIGRANFQINLTVNSRENKVAIQLWISDDQDKKFFDALLTHKENAEASIGATLDWRRLDGKKTSSIDLYRLNSDFTDSTQYQDIFVWYKDYTERFIKFFKPIIKKL